MAMKHTPEDVAMKKSRQGSTQHFWKPVPFSTCYNATPLLQLGLS
jgi:hypothetical protein